MRRHVPVIIGSYIALIGFYFLFHRHIYVLGQVIYTYAVFSHQNLNYYEYPQPTASDLELPPLSSNRTEIVPRIIHQIFLEEQPPPEIQYTSSKSHTRIVKHTHAMQTCTSLHPDWEFRLWTSTNATTFIGSKYPYLLHTYLSYPQTIQRANILRYLLLHHYGGVYLDLDLACRASLNSLLYLPWLTPGAYPSGINNAFILAKPLHPFLDEMLIPKIKERNLWWGLPYVTNMLSTGCMFISTVYARADKSELFILGGGTKHYLRGRATTPLFEHFGDSTWHRWDASLILWIGRNRVLSLIAVVGLPFGIWWIFFGLSKMLKRRQTRLAKSWKAMEQA